MVMFMRNINSIIFILFSSLFSSSALAAILIKGLTFDSPQAFVTAYKGTCQPTLYPSKGNFQIVTHAIIKTSSIDLAADFYNDNKCTVLWNSGFSFTVSFTPAPSKCSTVVGQNGKIGWNSYYWGNVTPSTHVCSSIGGGCVAQTGESLCIDINPEDLKKDPSLYDCDALYLVKDKECSQSGEYPFCTDNSCTDFLPQPTPNPDPEPEPEPQPDPEHNPSDPTSSLPDSGGEVINPTVPPKPPTEEKPKPDVETPDPTPDSNSDVVQSVTGMNEDMNELLTRLNSDNNKQLDDVNNQLLQLNTQSQRIVAQIAKQEKQDAAIYENTKALIQNLNKDVTTAVNKTTNAVNELGSKVDGLSDAVDGLAEDVSAIKDAITNVDTSAAGISRTCIESDTCTGFYESVYPDGITGIFIEHFDTVSESVTDTVKDFMKIDLSHAQRPSFSIPVLHFGNFNFDDYINLDWIFGFVRVCMMVTTAFLCRKIIFGG